MRTAEGTSEDWGPPGALRWWSGLRRSFDRVQASLLVVPILFVIGATIAAWAIGRIDIPSFADRFPLLVEVSPASARTILSTVAGATLTVAGIVFSMTAVTAQLAASHYTPRLVQGFLRDRFQQVVVGLVAGTFIFSLLALSAVDRRADIPEPSLSVTLAILLGLVSILGIISFLDRVGHRIEIDDTMRAIADRTIESLRRRQGDEAPEQLTAWSLPEAEPEVLRASRTGWVEKVDARRLLARMPPGSVVRLQVRAGAMVTQGHPIATSWGGGRAVAAAIHSAVTINDDRSVEQDPSLGFRQLVDIALRALSPGVNDPTTAADAVRHLVEPLAVALESEPRNRVHRGEDGRRVFLPEETTNSEFVHLAFTEIRMAAAAQPYVVESLVAALDAVHHRLHAAGFDHRCEPLVREAKALGSEVRTGKLPPDVSARLLQLVGSSDLLRCHPEAAGSPHPA